jgi:hypothetical protein
MPELADQNDWNVFVFNFFGGERDNQSARSDCAAELFDVVAYWTLTWGGTVGRQFAVPSPDPFVLLRYRVSSRHIASGEIHVNCQHITRRSSTGERT